MVYYGEYGKNRNKKFAVMAIAGILLVAMVASIAVTVIRRSSEDSRKKTEVTEHSELSAKMKAIKSVCQPTDYQKTCVDTLQSTAANTTDPKELISIAFQIAKNYIAEAAKTSTTLKELEKDPRTNKALQGCKELMEDAMEDFQRSVEALEKVGIIKISKVLDDLKTWLSATITYQETCLDGFENTTGDAGEQMKKALKTSMELSVNAIAMVSKLSSVFGSLNIGNINFGRRRLLGANNIPVLGHGEFYPVWLEPVGRRRLLSLMEPAEFKPDIVVAKDRSGNFTTINEAINFIPQKSKNTTVIYIKEGVYEEKVFLNRSYTNVFMVGDGAEKTRITGNLSFGDGTPTMQTATVSVLGEYFMAKNIGFENSAGAIKHQAVALRVGADMSIFYNCSMDGYQDTLYAHAKRQFYRDCSISGTIDFVFGDGSAVFQKCKFIVRKPMDNQRCIVTAQGRNWTTQPTAIVIQNSSIVADPVYYPVRDKLKSYLGRPWRIHSRTIIMESFIDDLIQPEGWLPWDGEFGIKTCFYTEFNNYGPGANKTARVTWEGVKTIAQEEALGFTPSKFFEGDLWIQPSGVPYNPVLYTTGVTTSNTTTSVAPPPLSEVPVPVAAPPVATPPTGENLPAAPPVATPPTGDNLRAAPPVATPPTGDNLPAAPPVATPPTGDKRVAAPPLATSPTSNEIEATPPVVVPAIGNKMEAAPPAVI